MRINRKRSPEPEGKPQQAKPQQAQRGDGGGKQPPALEQRLQKLVELERGTRELLEQREAGRLAAEKAESEQRLAAAEAALADARARKEQQREAKRRLVGMEEALAKGRSEVERLKGELAAARRKTEEARNEIKPKSERRVAEAEQALAEAREETEKERGWRVELEKRLEAVEQSEREARDTLEQELTAAEAQAAAAAEQRIAELEKMLAETRAEAEREREQRVEVEQRLEILAERDVDTRRTRERQLAEFELKRAEAERTAAEAREALVRERAERNSERKRILAIEQQLQALVTTGSARPTPEGGQEELEGPTAEPPPAQQEPAAVDVGNQVEESAPDADREPVPPLLEALGPVQSGSEEETTEPEPAPSTEEESETEEELSEAEEELSEAEEELSEAEEELSDTEEDELSEAEEEGELSEAEEKPSKTPLQRMGVPRGRRRRRDRRLRNQMSVCVVCTRTLEGVNPKQLTASGWIVKGDVSICPECQGFGWQLPEGGGLPFRRSSAKQPSS
jgi:hypothetical protein